MHPDTLPSTVTAIIRDSTLLLSLLVLSVLGLSACGGVTRPRPAQKNAVLLVDSHDNEVTLLHLQPVG